VATATGQCAGVSCPGQSDTLLIRADDKPFLMLGLAVLASLLLGAVALIVFVVLLVLRRRRSRAGPSPPAYPLPY